MQACVFMWRSGFFGTVYVLAVFECTFSLLANVIAGAGGIEIIFTCDMGEVWPVSWAGAPA